MGHDIIDGPSKFDLMVGLFHGDSHHRHTVDFSIKPPPSVPGSILKITKRGVRVFINSVEREDGSGEKWNLMVTIDGKYVKAYYDTKSRTGHMLEL
ncbi:MAG: hypothetical protein Q7S10_00930 [bacterium]|nr:hypothetical protein [bacterium]